MNPQVINIIAKAVADTLHEEGYKLVGHYWVREDTDPTLSILEFNEFVMRGYLIIVKQLQEYENESN